MDHEWLTSPTLISSQLQPTPEHSLENFDLSSHLISSLTNQKISYLFPVQAQLFPLLTQKRFSNSRVSPGDICVAAPTGSGKTLAYVLPIVDTLLPRIIPRVRALVLLPTKDLAIQVKQTFDQYLKGTHLRCCLLTGTTSLLHEQQILNSQPMDIIIATPGRLLEHMQSTRGFSLQHLRFLVLDEADRLLGLQFQHYLPKLLNFIYSQTFHLSNENESLEMKNLMKIPLDIMAKTSRFDAFKTDPLDTLETFTPLQKLLFSATLTQDLSKLAPLKLYRPTLISVTVDTSQQSTQNVMLYTLPETLDEKMLITEPCIDKPSLLLYLLFHLNCSSVLIFTKSVQSAHRLACLLESFQKQYRTHRQVEESTICAMSSYLSSKERKKLRERFESQHIQALVCTDLMARGMNLDNSVNVVVNYDIPSHIKYYVHRVGRCARAGKSGIAYTLLETHQVHWFKKMSKKLKRSTSEFKMQECKVNKEWITSIQPTYQKALAELEHQVKWTIQESSDESS